MKASFHRTHLPGLTAGLLRWHFCAPRLRLAQQPTPSGDAVNAIASQLYARSARMSPGCLRHPGLRPVKRLVGKLAVGTKTRSVNIFSQYGDQVVSAPPPAAEHPGLVLPPWPF